MSIKHVFFLDLSIATLVDSITKERNDLMPYNPLELFTKTIHAVIATGKGDLPEVPESLEFESSTCDGLFLVWLSVSLGLTQATVFEGRGGTIRQAVLSAVDLLKRHQRLAPAQPVNIRLDILVSYESLSSDELNGSPQQKLRPLEMDEGLGFGLNIQYGLLAEELIGWNVVTNKMIDTSKLLLLLKNHFSPHVDSESFVQFMNNNASTLYRISTRTFSVVNDRFLDHSSEGSGPLTDQTVLEAIQLAKDHYLKQVVGRKGKMVYSYLPQKNVSEKKYNILRHCGTLYSMLETFELMPDPDLMVQIRSAIKYLISKTESFSFQDHSCMALVEKDSIKVGGNALAIIAFAKYSQLRKSTKYLPTMQSLAKWIQLIQDDTGRFTVHKQAFSTGVASDFVSGYYPGEAMLAMARLYQLDGNEEWLDVAERSAHYLINERDKHASVEDIVHDHWLLYALNELYRERPKPLYLEHIILIADAIVLKQIRDHNNEPKYNGAYYLPHPRPESTPTACRSEGLCAAYSLMRDLGIDEKTGPYLETIEAGLKFQLQTQFRPETAMFYRNPRFCVGAFKRSLSRDDLRIDFTQHNLSSLIGYYRVLLDEC